MLFITWFSERVNQRSLVGFVAQLWILPCLIAMLLLPATASKWASFAVVTTLLSYPYRKFSAKATLQTFTKFSQHTQYKLDGTVEIQILFEREPSQPLFTSKLNDPKIAWFEFY